MFLAEDGSWPIPKLEMAASEPNDKMEASSSSQLVKEATSRITNSFEGHAAAGAARSRTTLKHV
eukprot:SAG31_NODE_856_length_11439_cov_3.721233_11_plen_64_part_00